MQTFLPYPTYLKSAECLDTKRLGKQRVEAKQIINVLEGRTKGWKNHPAVLMWADWLPGLKNYYNVVLFVWKQRGFKNTMEPEVITEPLCHPAWLEDPRFCASHRSNLLRKDPEHYGQFNWEEPDDLPYFWPTKEEW